MVSRNRLPGTLLTLRCYANLDTGLLKRRVQQSARRRCNNAFSGDDDSSVGALHIIWHRRSLRSARLAIGLFEIYRRYHLHRRQHHWTRPCTNKRPASSVEHHVFYGSPRSMHAMLWVVAIHSLRPLRAKPACGAPATPTPSIQMPQDCPRRPGEVCASALVCMDAAH